MIYPVYFILGILPSAIWLLFYLKKDSHPESSPMILKIFFLGMLISIPVIGIETGFSNLLALTSLSPGIIFLAKVFLGVAFTEEFFKYLVVKLAVLRSSELDEPVDIVLYMIIAALGFAAIENILILSKNHLTAPPDIFWIITARFVGATFLHALCSGVIGFFLALSVYQARKQFLFIGIGLWISTILHGLYNFSIIAMKGSLKFIIPVLVLISLAIFVSLTFQKLKKIRSVCKIN
ncbi:MAG: PrsW family intramembrane metalloprotease [bacterium]